MKIGKNIILEVTGLFSVIINSKKIGIQYTIS